MEKIDVEDMFLVFSDRGVEIKVNEIEETHNNVIFITMYTIFINDTSLRRELETEIRQKRRLFGFSYSIKEVYKDGENLLGIYIRPNRNTP